MQVEKIAFRVDASGTIGSGHFMRCLTLAIGLREQGCEVSFICRHLPESYAVYLSNNKIDLYRLEQRPTLQNLTEAFYLNWLGTTQENDANDTIKAIKHVDWDWIVVDHYALDISWESLIKPYAKNLMVIDDLLHQHQCDLLLDQNYYHQESNPYQDRVPKDCKVLLGPKYALLRSEFQSARKAVDRTTNVIHRVLIFFGGMDADNMTSQAIEAISSINDQAFLVDVVIGNQHPNKESIIQTCQRLSYHCHVQTDQMAALMAKADICIGAGGSATWERCALGLPTITVCVAENQRSLCLNAREAGLIYFPEWEHDHLVEDIKLHFLALLKNPFLRKSISQKAMQLIDAQGAARVISHLRPVNMVLKQAKAEDMQSIFEWRNHADIRAISRNQDVINWDDHQTWYKHMLSSNDTKLLIARLDNVDIGVVRFDLNGIEAEISIYLTPGLPKNGLGTSLLEHAENWLHIHYPSISEISAEVLASNPKSQQFFIKNGFSMTSSLFKKRLS